MNADEAAALLVSRVRRRPWGLAALAVTGDNVVTAFDSGDDELHAGSVFQIGSITKTLTGLLLADCVSRGELALSTTIGDVLPETGAAAALTLEAIVTHRSGLPRLPANLKPADPKDPYAAYHDDDLFDALRNVELGVAGTFEYSNFGFMTLGRVMKEATGLDYADLLQRRVFDVIGMKSAGCPPGLDRRIPGYHDGEETPWWGTNLPGAGGIGMNIEDLGRYLRAYLDGTGDDRLDEAMTLATTMTVEPPHGMGLGWMHQGGGWWHNGGTGGFRSFLCFHKPTRTGVAMLANTGDAEMLDRIGMATITEMVRAHAPS
jgi:CubicO group peptidase (beta-lactamase class C family)